MPDNFDAFFYQELVRLVENLIESKQTNTDVLDEAFSLPLRTTYQSQVET